MVQHKWHKEIKAWADGVEIEFRHFSENEWGAWESLYEDPAWLDHDNIQYRIKPQPIEPKYLYVWEYKEDGSAVFELSPPNEITEDAVHKYLGKIKLETDGE